MTEEERQTMEVFRKRKRSYQLALNATGMQEMLTDLAAFCHAVRTHKTDTEELSPTRLAILVGRQQVWERIQHHFNLSTEQLYALYTGRTFFVTQEEDDVAA